MRARKQSRADAENKAEEFVANDVEFGVHGNNQVSTTGFSYDAPGNVMRDGIHNYVWNGEGQITKADTTNYSYDGDGQRVEKSGGMIYWHGAGGEVLDETDLQGNLKDEYVYFGGKRIAERDSSGNIYYYGEDHLGSSRVMVQAGQTSPCYDADFLPYGQEVDYTSNCGSHFKFTGKERDTETGLDNFGTRYNSSSLGRFMSPDTLNTLDLSHPQKLNRYAYASNNPTTLVDVEGRCAAPAVSGGQVGICVESFIRTRFLPGRFNHLVLALGDNRGPNPHGGGFRTQTLLRVDPATQSVSIVSHAPGMSCTLFGCYQGTNKSSLSKVTHDSKGNTYFTLTVDGENGYEANGVPLAPTGTIGLQVSFKVDAKGNVTVLDAETKGYPSMSIYSYDSAGNVERGWQQPESGIINDLNGPLKPSDLLHEEFREGANRACALGNPAACD